MIKKVIFVTCVLATALQINAAFAQVKDQTFKDWTVYSTDLEGKKVCYIASFPGDKTGNYSVRDEPYLLVTHIDSATDEVSVSSGYAYKDNSKIKVTVDDDKTHYLSLLQGERAWAKDASVDKALIADMRAKNEVEVKGISTKGTYSLDRYSLAGFSAAYSRMKTLCK